LLIALILVFIVSAVAALGLVNQQYQSTILTFFVASTPTFMPSPTPPCVRPTLSLGAYIFPLEILTDTKDGSLPLPGGPAGTAWWLSDTFSPYVVIYEPAIRSLSLETVLFPGDMIAIQWADCGREEFVLSEFQQGGPDVQDLRTQNASGIVVIVQPVGTEDGFMLHGQRAEPIITPTQ